MNESEHTHWRVQARAIVRSSKIWASFFLAVALVLYFIEPALHAYLLVMSLLGVSYAAVLAAVWRRGSTWLFFLLVGYVSASATVAERWFKVESQYEDVQGVLLAFSFSGVVITFARDHFMRVLDDPESKPVQAEQDVS